MERLFNQGSSALRNAISSNGPSHWPPAILWLPALFIAGAMAVAPGYLIVRTLGAGSDLWDLLLRLRTLEILLRTILLVTVVTAASAAIAIPMAWITTRTNLPFRRVWAILASLPLVIPSYIGAFLVMVALGPRGVLQQSLEGLFGVDRLPDIYGFLGAAITLTLLSYPYILLPVRAALHRIDPSFEEASRSLGYGSWSTFRLVVLPLLRPAVSSGCLLVALYTLSDFGAVSIMRYETFTWAIYLQYDSALDRTLASGLSLVLILFTAVILLVETRTKDRASYHRSSSGTASYPTIFRLGLWGWPAIIFCATIVALSLVLPLSILAYWAIRGLFSGESIPYLWSTSATSLYVSALAAAAALLGAIPVALLAARYTNRITAVLERSSYIGFALPGITVALALVFFASQFAPYLYQTLGLLIFTYVVLFLPAALGPIRTSIVQMSPRIEEAARSLGKNPAQVLYSITLPALRPGLFAGAALVFLLAMKELPATLILGPIGFKTLSTSIWSAASEAFFAEAAIHAIILILVSSVPMAFLVFREQAANQ